KLRFRSECRASDRSCHPENPSASRPWLPGKAISWGRRTPRPCPGLPTKCRFRLQFALWGGAVEGHSHSHTRVLEPPCKKKPSEARNRSLLRDRPLSWEEQAHNRSEGGPQKACRCSSR